MGVPLVPKYTEIMAAILQCYFADLVKPQRITSVHNHGVKESPYTGDRR